MSGALLDLHPREWPAWMAERGAQPFHGRIAARWVFRRGAGSWEEMTDLPAALRARLDAEEPLLRARVDAVHEAEDGAVKLLLRFPDGAAAEAVGMPGTQGRTICLSTQVGCPVRCTFCASGADGLERNLAPGEVLEQALQLRRHQGEFQRVVVMGMGDAGFNLDATLAALESLIDEEGAGMSARRITLSTVAPRGVLERIRAWGRKVDLAISLHAPDDALRRELVPGVAKRTIAETIDEAERLFASRGREYTLEYVLLEGVNDAPDQARDLAALLRGRRCHLNLIPYNPVPGTDYRRPSLPAQRAFAAVLEAAGHSVTLRRSLGSSAEAACGQLRRRSLTC
jgi:23S rRNA (adenine2503-C2)-methyltransferase